MGRRGASGAVAALGALALLTGCGGGAGKAPRTRYRVTPSAKILLNVRRVTTDRAWDRMVKGQFPQPGPS